MCGILGIASFSGPPSLTDAQAERLRDLMTHRGPDGGGLWRSGPFLFAHRRLAVVDPTPAGAQPMADPTGRYALTYNGELYNDAEIRRRLAAEGVRFQSACDAETLLHALIRWGEAALPKLRGMYAFGFADAGRRSLLLARDPLGVKPLVYSVLPGELLFASEAGPILSHPRVTPAPDLVAASAYLTTIRTTLGSRTLFENVLTLPPGEAIALDLSRDEPEARQFRHAKVAPVADWHEAEAAEAVRAAVEDSVAAHLRADVPLCALLSGGLDSTITAQLAAERHADLHTFCAGAPSDSDDDDLACARRAASALGTTHHEARLDAETFAELWPRMIERLGLPLSTPNEVAIYAVARTLRDAGCVVTLSGEGADELFAGYESAMISARRHAGGEMGSITGGRAHLAAGAWMAPALKSAMLRPDLADAFASDEPLAEVYDELFEDCRAAVGDSGDLVDAHLRFIEAINLTGLLRRLDAATMLASVEGRTPFADAAVANLARSIPTSLKFAPAADAGPAAGSVATATAAGTKLVLRRAFADTLPAEPLARPKASFPLPFQSWLPLLAPRFRRSPFARELFAADAIEQVAANPAKHWKIAWPMMNLALWGDRWWG